MASRLYRKSRIINLPGAGSEYLEVSASMSLGADPATISRTVWSTTGSSSAAGATSSTSSNMFSTSDTIASTSDDPTTSASSTVISTTSDTTISNSWNTTTTTTSIIITGTTTDFTTTSVTSAGTSTSTEVITSTFSSASTSSITSTTSNLVTFSTSSTSSDIDWTTIYVYTSPGSPSAMSSTTVSTGILSTQRSSDPAARITLNPASIAGVTLGALGAIAFGVLWLFCARRRQRKLHPLSSRVEDDDSGTEGDMRGPLDDEVDGQRAMEERYAGILAALHLGASSPHPTLPGTQTGEVGTAEVGVNLVVV
ncbi:hypothetical protein BJ138DRAFT_757455 [Hygrophoropsis aurantiaca]|uniref:Uncharacterized protein n=1 Tax=Hygrophoropsis aurantiaca TaxID=72124 RepID=A0ACB8AHI2_9AGAM|nr:hypothetical protein BJ138DRAFT_757455 [Hygrophoropsis aurantiaca]